VLVLLIIGACHVLSCLALHLQVIIRPTFARRPTCRPPSTRSVQHFVLGPFPRAAFTLTVAFISCCCCIVLEPFRNVQMSALRTGRPPSPKCPTVSWLAHRMDAFLRRYIKAHAGDYAGTTKPPVTKPAAHHLVSLLRAVSTHSSCFCFTLFSRSFSRCAATRQSDSFV
jgi:hypothetical protein